METVSTIESFTSVLSQNQLLAKYGISRIGVFGSFARGETSNDIDVFIEENINPFMLLEFKEELENLTSKKIDLVMKKYANPIILYRAEKDMLYVS